MAREIRDFGNFIAPDSTYPYGDIKDDSGSGDGTPVSRLTASDIWQFFQKIADQSGITLNGLADNATNGFQFAEAFNKIVNGQTSVLATAAGAGGFTPIVAVGMEQSTSIGLVIAEGYFFYNSKLYYFPGGSAGVVSVGYDTYITLSEDSGLPIGTLNVLPDTTPVDADNVLTSMFLDNQIVIPSIINKTGLSWLTGSSNHITVSFSEYGIQQKFYTLTTGTGTAGYITLDTTTLIVGAKTRIIAYTALVASVSISTPAGSKLLIMQGDNLFNFTYKVIELEYIGNDGTDDVFLITYSV